MFPCFHCQHELVEPRRRECMVPSFLWIPSHRTVPNLLSHIVPSIRSDSRHLFHVEVASNPTTSSCLVPSRPGFPWRRILPHAPPRTPIGAFFSASDVHHVFFPSSADGSRPFHRVCDGCASSLTFMMRVDGCFHVQNGHERVPRPPFDPGRDWKA